MSMQNTRLHHDVREDDPPSKWMGVPYSEEDGVIDELRRTIPAFEKRPFVLAAENGRAYKPNPLFDSIVRRPMTDSKRFVPVGVVSKNYQLVQHRDVWDHAVRAIKDAGIEAADIKSSIKLTQFGERMQAIFELPEKYAFNLGEGDPMNLRLECLNSVDGSMRFSALMTWMRQVCGNGLVMRTEQVSFRRRHDDSLDPANIGAVFREGLKLAELEKEQYNTWAKTVLGDSKVKRWIDGPLRQRWGPKAAARAFAILNCGYDGDFLDPFAKAKPSEKAISREKKVPGVFPPAQDLFAICQTLAWIAKERNGLQEQIDRMKQIPELTNHLLN